MDQNYICAIDSWKNNDVDPRNGSDTYTYIQDLTDIFNNHNTDDPLFLYLLLQWLALYPENSTCNFRRKHQAMASVPDNITGHVV